MNIITSEQESNIAVSIENSGVTKMFTECRIKLALLNEKDAVAAEFLTDWDANGFLAGSITELTADMKFKAEKGSYRLAIGFFDGEGDAPAYKLGNSIKTKDNWFIIGDIELR